MAGKDCVPSCGRERERDLLPLLASLLLGCPGARPSDAAGREAESRGCGKDNPPHTHARERDCGQLQLQLHFPRAIYHFSPLIRTRYQQFGFQYYCKERTGSSTGRGVCNILYSDHIFFFFSFFFLSSEGWCSRSHQGKVTYIQIYGPIYQVQTRRKGKYNRALATGPQKPKTKHNITRMNLGSMTPMYGTTTYLSLAVSFQNC